MYKNNKVFLGMSFVLAMSITGTAQNGKTTNNTTAQNTSVATSPASSSERELDGFVGPVRRVKTEVVRLANKGGKFIEGPRALLENAAYDIKGVKSEYSYYPGAIVAFESNGRETYKYDEKGNISEMTLLNSDGSLAKKEVYVYEYDFLSNWVKMSTSVAVIEGGKLNYEPTEVTYRTISYYMDADVMAKMEAFQKAQTAGTQPSNTVAANTTPTSTPGNSQPQPTPQVMTKSDLPTNSTTPNTNHSSPTSTPANTNNGSSITPKVDDKKVDDKKVDDKKVHDKKVDDKKVDDKKVDDKKVDDKKVDDVAKNQIAPANTTEQPKVIARQIRPISGGVLNGKAVNLPMPDYPDFAKRSNIGGLVTIEVVIDENGKVISAKAIAGPGMLQQAAVSAALRARFSPTLLSGQAVKVTGVINYNFALR